MTSIAIIIPARYASTRFPGKPMALIAGRPMIERVVDIARAAIASLPQARYAVATEDARIVSFCQDRDIPVVLTDDTCKTGTDRMAQAIKNLGWPADILLGLQGDAPFTPVAAVTGVVQALIDHPSADVATPVVKLRWAELDRLRENKKSTPFSGTTCVMNESGRAFWFSKNIIPGIRKEDALRTASEFSPVYQHLGLYGYRAAALERFNQLPEGVYERLEGLEQLRLIENGMWIQTVPLTIDLGLAQSGVDSPEDVVRAEEVIRQYGEPLRQ